jgi:hypothetical protein
MSTAMVDARRVGTVAVLVTGEPSDDTVIAAAVSAAAECGGRISILTVPRRVPLGAHGVSLGYTAPFSALTLRAEALVEAATAARRAADLVPAHISAEYVVVPGSAIRAMKDLVEDQAVAHIVVDRRLLVRRPRLRRALGGCARGGMPFQVV